MVRVRPLLLAPLLALGLLAVPSQGAAPARLMGVDTSVYQHDGGRAIDWQAVRRSGQTFAFLRASHGTTVDTWYQRDRAAARAAGLVIGSYHFADPRRPAEQEAAQVTRIVGTTRQAGDLGIVLDLEDSGGLKPPALVRWAHQFLEAVQARTGRTPIVYSGVNFWKNEMAGDRSFGAYPLWIPRYADRAPAPNAGWSRWTFWQYTSSGHVPGIPGLVDRDVMCCSLGTLQALADGRSRLIAQKWKELGGASGQLGLPLGTEQRVTDGWGQVFESGYVGSTRETGTHAVLGAVWGRYKAAGAGSGVLGVPVTGRRTLAAGVTDQRFAGGRIVHSDTTGAHALRGPVLDRWVALGGPRSTVGLPSGEQVGAGQQFVGAGLYDTGTGVLVVPGALRDRYEELGGPAGLLGLPTSEAITLVEGTRTVTFERGQLTEVTVAGQTVVI